MRPLLLCLSVLAVACGAPQRPSGPPLPAQAALTPAGLAGVYLGMEEAALVAARPAAAIEGEPDHRATYVERAPASGIAGVTYYVGRQDAAPQLYELIVDYPDEAATSAAYQAYAAEGAVVAGEMWPTVHVDRYPFPVRIWQLPTAIVIAAALPGTEWDGEWDDVRPAAP